MKKIIVVVSLLVCLKVTAFAQCLKNVVLNASKTEYLDGTGALQKTVDEKSIIEISKTELILTPGNEERKMNGVVKSDSCNWKVPYKDGKSVIKATFSREGESTLNATLTIEGKEGKVTVLMEVDEMPDRKIRVMVDKYEEKK